MYTRKKLELRTKFRRLTDQGYDRRVLPGKEGGLAPLDRGRPARRGWVRLIPGVENELPKMRAGRPRSQGACPPSLPER